MNELRALLVARVSGNERFWNNSLETEGKGFKLNTGASGVIIVHSIDGFVDSVSSEMFNLIRIYDGSVSSINKLGEQAEKYNEDFASANAQWNALVSQMNQLNDEIATLNERDEVESTIYGMSKREQADIVNAIAKLMDYKDIQNLSIKHDMPIIVEGVKNRYKESVEIANEGKTEVTVFHQYLSDKFKGVKRPLRATDAMTMEDSAVDNVFGFLSQILEHVQAEDLKIKFPYARENGIRNVVDLSINGFGFDSFIGYNGGSFVELGLNDGNASIIVVGSTLKGEIDREANGWQFTKEKMNDLAKLGAVVLKIPTMKKLKGRDSKFTDADVELVKREIDKLFELLPDGYNVGFMPTVRYDNVELRQRFKMRKDELIARGYGNVKAATASVASGENILAEEQAEYINHSGGAYGADTFWGIIGKEHGVKSRHYKSQKDNRVSSTLKKAGESATLLTDSQIEEGIPFAKQAAASLGKAWSAKPETQLLLARNWFQVKNADAVYAIAELEGGYVKGGTGYAVAMAVNANKPVYVFDPIKNKWFKRGENAWTPLSSAPKLTPNFAGIGTRDVETYNQLDKATGQWIPRKEYLGEQATKNAQQAIRDVYEATFGEAALGSGSKESVAVDSNQTGLEYALTNPTHTSPKGFKWIKGDEDTRKYLASGIDYNGKHYADVEQAYQANNTKAKGIPQDDNYDYALMVDLIEIKLNTFPRLIADIDKQGCLEYLNRIVHKPTGGKSRWETGNKDLFKKALTESYNRVISSGSIKQLTAEDIVDIDLSPSEAEVVNDIMSDIKDNKDCPIA